MLSALTSLMGGGSIAPGGGTATSGDASAGIQLDFTSNNAFSVGGSGKQTVDATASTSSEKDQSTAAGAASGTSSTANDKTLLYIGAGIIGLVVVIGAFALLKD
jgi:hypothetical protein